MRSFRPWFAVPACLGVLAASGCGSNSCQDAVNANLACTKKLNASPGLDRATCEALVCERKEAFLDCFVGLACTDLASYNAAADACGNENGCR